MPQAQKQADSLLKLIQDHIDSFNESIPKHQRDIYNKVAELLKGLQLKSGRIDINNIENYKLIPKVLKEIESFMLDPAYQKSVADYLTAFDTVSAVHNTYFSTLVKDFKPTKVLAEVKKQSIDATLNSLTEAGVNEYIGKKAGELLRTSITSGMKYADMVDSLRSFIVGDAQADGSLARYAKQITTDALNQYSAQYSSTLSQDLGLEWGMYVGSNLTTTRPFCEHLTKKRYIHKSELSTVLNVSIDGVKLCSKEIPCAKTTGLPSGMIPGTNPENFIINRGGYNCGHQFIWVTESMVPKDVLDKFKNQVKVEQKPKQEPPAPEPKIQYTEKQIANAKANYNDFLRLHTLADYDIATIGKNEAMQRMEYHNNIVNRIHGGDKELEREWKNFFLKEQVKADQKAAQSKAKLAANKEASADILQPIKDAKRLVEYGKWLNNPKNPFRKEYFNKKYTQASVDAFLAQ
jgi:hypothetical protein